MTQPTNGHGTSKTVTFNKAKLASLKRAYRKAVESNHSMFVFEDSELLTAYAMYLIEYLESRIK